MSALQERELKQQGAIEAAEDPEAMVTADDAQQKMVEESKNAGVPAFTFDPDATPEQKRAQAQAVSRHFDPLKNTDVAPSTVANCKCWCMSKPRLTRPPLLSVLQAIPPELQRSRRPKGAAIITDVDDGTGPDEVLPDVGKAGVLDVAKDADGNKLLTGVDPGSNEAPYSRTGWAPKFGWGDSTIEAASLLDHTTWLEGRLPHSLYGGESSRSRIGISAHKHVCLLTLHKFS